MTTTKEKHKHSVKETDEGKAVQRRNKANKTLKFYQHHKASRFTLMCGI